MTGYALYIAAAGDPAQQEEFKQIINTIPPDLHREMMKPATSRDARVNNSIHSFYYTIPGGTPLQAYVAALLSGSSMTDAVSIAFDWIQRSPGARN